jgi:DNA-binding MarR family transcriptional regulator
MTTDFALEEFLPYRLSVVSNRASRLFARRYSEAFGISIAEWRVLAVVGRFGGLSASAVVERTAMDKVKVSRAVRGLLARGLLVREGDAADRRVQRLAMTPAGQGIHGRILPLARGLEADLLTGLAAADRAALHRLLDALDARLAEMGAGPDTEGPD